MSSTGAAAGYVEDAACATCHQELWQSYQEVGMARSFGRPSQVELIEDFGQTFFHQASERYYSIRQGADGELTFRRHQLDSEGREVNAWEQPIDWILGSGHTSRVYLFQVASGEIYQLPLSWYSQDQRWAMAPGFDRPDHDGVTRRVRRECMFCHNAFPQVAAGSDAYGEPQVFPKELPAGTGCQRCHGPGGEHVAMALAGEMDVDLLRATVVNPAKLSPERRNEVCYGCHLQPSVEMMGVRRFGRGDYSLRPGQKLADYLVLVDTEQAGRERGERFEINHHPYRLEQSQCFDANPQELSCLTCHDPHRKVPAAARAEHYRKACMSCHAPRGCARPEAQPATDDCASCHMPRRRTQDVVHVVMTDHRIQLPPAGDTTAPLAEQDSILESIEISPLPGAPEGKEAKLYEVIAVQRAGGTRQSLEYLHKLLEEMQPEALAPWLSLARGQLASRQFDASAATLQRILDQHPRHLVAAEWMGLARIGQGRLEEAAKIYQQAAKARPNRPEVHFNLGHLRLKQERAPAALEALRRSVELRPNQPPAWFYIGLAEASLGRPEAATAALRQAIEVDPSHHRSYYLLGSLALRQEEPEQARSWWRLGKRYGADTRQIEEALASLPSNPGGQ